MLGQWRTKLVLATLYMIFNHVDSSILIDPVPQDISWSFSENNSTTNQESADIRPRKRDVSTLNRVQLSEVKTTKDEEIKLETDSSHLREVRAVRHGFARIRGGFGRGGFRAVRGRYNPYWGGGYNYPYRGYYGYYPYYYPYYYGGWRPRPRYWPRQRPTLIIG